MILIENVLNSKIVDPIEVYNFELGPFSIWVHLNNSKNLMILPQHTDSREKRGSNAPIDTEQGFV
jgi:hypothetical protein